MGADSFNAMELDAVGEIMNISLGASATAISTMLGTKVNITTPVAEVLTSDEFSFKRLEPAVGVDISYIKGLEGSNVMIFRRDDVRVIVGILMGMEIPEEEFELDEMNISAICEVMNQMMGSSATALAEFLGYPVDISTPKSFEITDDTSFKARYFPSGSVRVLVRFTLEIGDVLKSEFINIMTIDLTKRLLAPFSESFGEGDTAQTETSGGVSAPESHAESASKHPEGVLSQDQIHAMMEGDQGGGAAPEPAAQGSTGGMMSQAEIEALMAGSLGGAAEPAPQPAAQGGTGGMMSQAEIEAMMAGAQGGESAPAAQTAPTQPASAPAAQAAPTQSASTPAAQPQPAPGSTPQPAAVVYQQPAMDPMMLQLMNQMQQSQMQMMKMMDQMQQDRAAAAQQPAKEAQSRPNTVIHPVNSPKFADDMGTGVEEQANQEMLMKVPLEISVEIGRTKKLVKDILEFTQGSLVVLDKMAGERADVFVNGECIARGDIVVVEDNFGIRITEIVSRNLNPESL